MLIFSHGEHGVHGEYLLFSRKFSQIHANLFIQSLILFSRGDAEAQFNSSLAYALASALALSQHIPIQPIKYHQFIICRIEADQPCDWCKDLIGIQDR